MLDREKRLLLLRFEHKSGPLCGQVFWATPGGGVDEGESFEEAALRELYEEVGLRVAHPGPQIAQRTAIFTLSSGEMVEADERYFVVEIEQHVVSNEHCSDLEREVMTTHRWWSQSDLLTTSQQIWPEDLSRMLIDAGAWAVVS